MADPRHYDEELRAIGQALEARQIEVFELKHGTDRYNVSSMGEQNRPVSSRIRQWVGRQPSDAALTFGQADVERLTQAGRARRSTPGQRPDFRSVSNSLRTIGAYLDAQEFELIELQKRPISITLAYRDKEGRKQIEDRTLSSFQNFFNELCERRGHA